MMVTGISSTENVCLPATQSLKKQRKIKNILLLMTSHQNPSSTLSPQETSNYTVLERQGIIKEMLYLKSIRRRAIFSHKLH